MIRDVDYFSNHKTGSSDCLFCDLKFCFVSSRVSRYNRKRVVKIESKFTVSRNPFYLNMKILIQFAHPALQKSRVNRLLVQAACETEDVFVNDLYERYPDFNIDVKREQQLLLDHDLVVFQHPFYWYSSPAILKEWQDLVLEHNFAYGRHGKALSGKYLCSVISTGGPREAYQVDGYNRFSIMDLLAPFRQTAFLCGMIYLPPFLVQGTHALSEDVDIPLYAAEYRQLLEKMRDNKINLNEVLELESLNSVQ